MVGPASGALLTDTVPADRRRTAFSLFHWAVNIGTAVAGILGGFLAAHGYWLLFAVDAATSLAYAVIVVTLLPGARVGDAPVADAGSGTGYAVVFRDPLMRVLLPLFGIALVIYSLTEVCLPLAIRDDGLSPATLGMMATLNAVLVVVLQPVATQRPGPVPAGPGVRGGERARRRGIALTGVADDVWTYGGTVVLWSLGEAAVGGIPGGIIAGLAPDDARGRYQGSYQWTWGIARFVALGVGAAVYAADRSAVVVVQRVRGHRLGRRRRRAWARPSPVVRPSPPRWSPWSPTRSRRDALARSLGAADQDVAVSRTRADLDGVIGPVRPVGGVQGVVHAAVDGAHVEPGGGALRMPISRSPYADLQDDRAADDLADAYAAAGGAGVDVGVGPLDGDVTVGGVHPQVAGDLADAAVTVGVLDHRGALDRTDLEAAGTGGELRVARHVARR